MPCSHYKILDDATIAAMTPPTPAASDWKAAMKEWEAWEETQTKHTPHAS